MGAVTPPTGPATVVLGDVAGSTLKWQEQPEAMSAASRRLNTLIDQLVGTHDGHRPREQGEGDNFVAVFPAAADATAFALELDTALGTEAWPDDLTIGMRIGIHTGDVEWAEETGYLGPTFNRCARIRDLGHARMILVSQATRDIIADGLPDGVALGDLGLHQLRDLSRDEHVYQVTHPGSPEQFPPLKSISSLPNNLPIPVTSLVGREEDISNVSRLLLEHRLVTLTGAGGSGKTRLAQHVASEVLSFAPNGAWWVDLMPVNNEDRVAPAIAEAAGIEEVGGSNADELLAAGIGDKQMLLVIDNCEHVIDVVADIIELLLHRCREVRVLATSRETIGIEGEHAVRVRPLGVPEGEIQAADLSKHAATQLFVERAQAAGPFTPTDEDAEAIATICRRLDGLPLAIELSAARTRLLGAKEIAAALDDRFALLGATGRRGRASRQRTLEASVAWSFELLDDEEQAVLCRLGVFPAAFDLDGATFVGTLGAGGHHVLDVLSSLVDKSLVTVRPAEDGRRYRLLETIRQYALDRLAERGEAEAARDAHLDHLVAVCGELRLRVLDRLNASWWDFETWIDDIRAAEQWAMRQGRPGAVVRMRAPFFGQVSNLGGAGEWLRAIGPLLDDERLTEIERARARMIGCALFFTVGDPARGVELGTQALAALEHGDDIDQYGARYALALAKPYVDATGVEESTYAWERITGSGSRAAIGVMHGTALLHADRWLEAREVFTSAMEGGAESGFVEMELLAMSMLTVTQNVLGDLGESMRLARESWHRMREEAPRYLGVHAAANGFWPLVFGGQFDEARQLVADASAAAGPPGTMSHLYAQVGEACLAVNDADAERILEVTGPLLERLSRTSMSSWTTGVLGWRAWAHAATGDHGKARALLAQADALLPPRGWAYYRGTVTWARSEVEKGDPPARVRAVAEFLRTVKGTAHRGGWWPSLTLAGVETLRKVGEHEAAARVLGASLEHGDAMGFWVPPGWADIEALKSMLEKELAGDYERLLQEGRQLGHEEASDIVIRAAGLDPDAPAGSGDRAVSGWASLTPAEVDVARKVADGLTNAEAAEALFVSTNTVKTHLKNIYTKLDISSRAELATEVASQDQA
ncbi:MAG: LuxR C-terminal-related transcriptional regulator [Nitriliruptorales bacterium]|nr:LuxR C-terminal-related transcriptional regulator [Nitriliruptorales bacterium]